MNRRLLVSGTLIALCVALGATWLLVLRPAASDSGAIKPEDLVNTRSPTGTGSAAKVGQPAPELALDRFGGGSFDLSSLRGRPAVINFWSSTCAPCIKEMPLMERVHEKYGDEVAFVGVDVFDTREQGRSMIDRTGVTYPQALDTSNHALTDFGGTQLPHTVVLRADGTVAALHNRTIKADDDLVEMIERARADR